MEKQERRMVFLAMAQCGPQTGYRSGFDKPFYPCMGRNLAWKRDWLVEHRISVLAPCPDNAGTCNAFLCSKENDALIPKSD